MKNHETFYDQIWVNWLAIFKGKLAGNIFGHLLALYGGAGGKKNE